MARFERTSSAVGRTLMAACEAACDDAESAPDIKIWTAEHMRSWTVAVTQTELHSARLLGVGSGAFA